MITEYLLYKIYSKMNSASSNKKDSTPVKMPKKEIKRLETLRIKEEAIIVRISFIITCLALLYYYV